MYLLDPAITFQQKPHAKSALPQSGVPGVIWYRKTNQWKARIMLRGREIRLGLFATIEEAVAARKQAELQYGITPQNRYNSDEERKQAQRQFNKKFYAQHRDTMIERARRHRKLAPAEVRASSHKSYHKRKNADPLKYIIYNTKRRAIYNGIIFDLSSDTIVMPEFCEVCGVRMIPCGGRFNPAAASIDRLYPSKGYVDGNVKFICLECNVLKRDCIDPWRFRALADYIERNSKNAT